MSVTCQKEITINVVPAGPCVAPTIKTWTTAAVTGKSFDLSGISANTQGMQLQSASGKVWVYPPNTPGSWFFDTFDITGATPIAPVQLYPNPDGGSPIAQGFIYVAAANKMVIWRQRWNGASFDLWLTFVNATTGIELSHIVGLSTETHRSQFCLVERTGLAANYVGWLNGNAGIHMSVYLINVDTETITTSRDIGATIANGICYCCDNDSFFVSQGNNLIELDRTTLATKNTYIGQATNSEVIDYVKSTQEVWGVSATNTTVDITKVGTGAYSNLTLAEQFGGWDTGVTVISRYYHESLNAFCIPGLMTGFSGNPTFYYFYDVVTKTLKLKLDISSQFQLFNFGNWWAQTFNISKGSIYVSAGDWQTPPNYGVFEIGAS